MWVMVMWPGVISRLKVRAMRMRGLNGRSGGHINHFQLTALRTCFGNNTHTLAGTTKHETLAKLKKWS
jgi:hypothetical protein